MPGSNHTVQSWVLGLVTNQSVMAKCRNASFLILLLVLTCQAQSDAQTQQPTITAQIAATPQPTATPAGMDPFRKDVIDASSKIGGVIGVFIAIFVAYVQLKKNREERRRDLEEAVTNRQQREEELRWRKANLARDLLEKLWVDVYVSAAMMMLLWSKREHTIKPETIVAISRNEVWDALRIEPGNFTETEKYIRLCFGQLFSVMRTVEHYLSIGLVEFSDISFPFSLLAAKLETKQDVVHSFLLKYEYAKTIAFLERFKNSRTVTDTRSKVPSSSSPGAVT